jgi:hypothetical protein
VVALGRTQPIDTQRRVEALAIAEQHGAAEASRRTGIPQATIRSWKHRAEAAASPEVDDVDRLERLAQEARRTAERALAKANEAIAAGRGTDARNLMVAHGIAVEKSGLLAQQAQAAREHQVRISEQQGKMIAALIRAFMESCGLPVGTPGVGAVIRALLEHCRDGEPSPLSPAEAEAARSEIREQIGSELQVHAAQLEEATASRRCP